MDRIDCRILVALQEDAGLPLAEIAERAGLSPSPCWRRMQKLADSGVIRKRVALVDPETLNVGTTVFVSIRTNCHDPKWSRDFCEGVARIPEVMEFYRLSGQVDYLLKIVVPNIAAYDKIYHKIIQIAAIYDVSSSFSMETIKYTTALPVAYAELDGSSNKLVKKTRRKTSRRA
ncbi:Lrp/AsnC family transcriptional regulator [Bradyrhizobium sp. AZCC 2262]|uniref:Lrp/AsnC family transcriptional regulator n=1 Tax=Bradyrhizobium sp. AZCC 2262 TaxID=3117022 RepID=UPI002FF29A37